MKIHEYQAKAILAHYGVPIQPGRVASTPEEAKAIAPLVQAPGRQFPSTSLSWR